MQEIKRYVSAPTSKTEKSHLYFLLFLSLPINLALNSINQELSHTLITRSAHSLDCFKKQLNEMNTQHRAGTSKSSSQCVSPHRCPQAPPSPCLHSCLIAYELAFGLLFLYTTEGRSWPPRGKMWILQSTAGHESHLVDSRSAVYIARGFQVPAVFQSYILPVGCSVT